MHFAKGVLFENSLGRSREMKQKRMKKLGSFLLAGAMVLTMFPTFHTEVHAAGNQLPTKEQFATVEELKTFNTNDNDGTSSAAKVYFGKNSQKWWIAGSQGENLTLFAESPLMEKQQYENDMYTSKTYQSDWKCSYSGTPPKQVEANHYGASPIRTKLKNLETSYFTDAEQALMNDTTIYTNHTNNTYVYSTTDKLYLAYGDHEVDEYITVGTNSAEDLDSGLRITNNYWGNKRFWLRAPDKEWSTDAYMIQLEGGRRWCALQFCQ